MRREHKIRVWRCIAFVGLFLCFLLGLGVGAHAQNANDILGKAAAAYENSNGISASFTMFTRSAGQNAGESFEGTIQMKGDKFTLVTPDALTWFNGTTQSRNIQISRLVSRLLLKTALAVRSRSAN